MLLAAGCSYTDENFTSVLHPEYDTSYKKWPEIVADKLGVMHKNLGACGAGNDYITKQLTMEILKNHKNITAVMVGWTEIHRFTIFDFYRCNPFATVANHKIPSMQKYKKFEPSHEELALIPFYDLLYGYGLFDKPKKPNGLFDKPKKPDNSKGLIVNRKNLNENTEEIIDNRELINQIGKKENDYGELKNNELKQELREGIRKQFPNYSDFQTITSPEEILSCRERTPDYVWNKVEEDLIKISILSGYK